MSEHDALIEVLASAAQVITELDRPGLLLTLDEVQEGPLEDLAVLTGAAQDLPPTPVVLLGAGLPNVPDRLMSAGSFAERFGYQALGPLDPPAATAALMIPATALGVTWDRDAAELILGTATGAPYLIQLFADAAWQVAQPRARGRISLAHAAAGVQAATSELHAGLFRARWNRATPLEQQYLSAIAASADPSGTEATADVAGSSGTCRASVELPADTVDR